MNEFGFWKRQSGFIIFKSAYMEKKMTTAVTWKYLKQSNKFKTEKLSISNIHSHRVKCPKLLNDGLITTWYFPQMFQSRFTVFNWLNIMESELPSKKKQQQQNESFRRHVDVYLSLFSTNEIFICVTRSNLTFLKKKTSECRRAKPK